VKISRVETLVYESGAADDWLFVKISTIEPRDGYLEVPTRPGIGFELSEEIFARRQS
jgi:L-alanine-DL-glutamate epimerase-like enolase superfamily enzyme